jgi:hypothetical protein
MMDIVVFVGPSLSPQEALERFPSARVLPPAGRGDLRSARAEGARLLVLIDGVFGQRHAVSPSEVVEVIRSGAVIVGASSMGAVRGAECWPAGMIGIGQVFQGFRDGTLDSDDEVAVVTDAENHFRATSVPLVNARAALAAVRNAGHIDNTQHERLWNAARNIHFAERGWRMILRRADVEPRPELLKALAEAPDLKREDALAALDYVRLHAPELLQRTTPPAQRDPDEQASEHRYVGHDPLMGNTEDVLKHQLLRWMVGSGRLQRYVWPLAAGELELADISSQDPSERSGLLRERLALVLRRLLSDEASFAQRLWNELEFVDELQTELLHLEAVRTSAARTVQPTSRALEWARESVAVEQGFPTWSSLLEDVNEGALYGALPLAWIEEAARWQAVARSL